VRTNSCLSILMILFLVGLMAQTASPAPPTPAQAAVCERGEPTAPGRAPTTAPASLLPFGQDGQAVYEQNLFFVDQPSDPGEQMAPGQGLATDLNRKDLTTSAIAGAKGPSLHALPLRGMRPNDMAFLKVAAQPRNERNAMRDKVAPLILSVALHASLTWDAQSTNHFFHHYPMGFKPAEVDPLMHPFAGKALMYPMANLLFGAPFDLLLLKTRHGRKPTRILTYAAAGIWAGLEMRQSVVNIKNEHLSSAAAAESARAAAGTNGPTR